jgi:hypothetical protein
VEALVLGWKRYIFDRLGANKELESNYGISRDAHRTERLDVVRLISSASFLFIFQSRVSALGALLKAGMSCLCIAIELWQAVKDHL